MLASCPLCAGCITGCSSRRQCSCSKEKLESALVSHYEIQQKFFTEKTFLQIFIPAVNVKLNRFPWRKDVPKSVQTMDQFSNFLKGLGKKDKMKSWQYSKHLYSTMELIRVRENQIAINKGKTEKGLKKEDVKAFNATVESINKGEKVVKRWKRKYRF